MRQLWLLMGLSTASVATAGSGARDLQAAYAELAQAVIPAVVGVETKRRNDLGPPLLDLLGRYDLELPESRGGYGEASGTAFIISPDGRVLTNHHVIDGAESIRVILPDERRVSARLVGSDPRSDVAVLQIDEEGPWPWLPLGDSSGVRVGHLVFVVGSPFDFRSTVTAGIVSATGRRELSPHEIQDYIQTDAAVNPGNSGGPVVDVDGRVIGIATAIYAPNVDQSSGVSFAIPIDMVRRIQDDLAALGRVRRSRIGLAAGNVVELEEDPTRGGAEITRVVPDGPAERAGLRRGDVVIAAGGTPVTSASGLAAFVLAQGVGEELELTFVRGGARETRVVTTVEEGGAAPEVVDLPSDRLSWAGMWVTEPSDRLRAHFGVPADRGVLVASVEPGGFAARLGVSPGDLVIAYAETVVRDLDHLTELTGADDAAGVRSVTLARGDVELRTLLPGRRE